jgi:hypothetical protein
MPISLRLPVFLPALALLTLAACSKSNDNAASTPGGASSGQTYTVNLNPPLQAGQKFSIVTDLSNSEQTKTSYIIPGVPTPQDQNRNTEMTAHIEADGEILAVFPNGSPEKVTLTLTNIAASINQVPLPALPSPGATVVLEKSGNTLTVAVNGAPIDDNVAKILRDALETGDANITNQTMFGPRSPVAIGSIWAVDSPSIIAAFKEGQGDISAVNGAMKLEALTGTGDDQVATISGNVKLEGYKPPLPPEVLVDASVGSLEVNGTIPAAAKGTKKLSTSMTMKLEAHGEQQGVQFKISSNGEQKKTSSVTFH